MRHNIAEIFAGTAVVLIAIGFLIFGATRVGVNDGGDTYDLVASFRSAEGISIGSDVRLAGVKVGTVRALDLNRETFRAVVTLALHDGVVLPDDSTISIASEGLLGGNFVEIEVGGSPFNYGSGDEVTNTQSAVSLTTLLMKFVSSGSE